MERGEVGDRAGKAARAADTKEVEDIVLVV